VSRNQLNRSHFEMLIACHTWIHAIEFPVRVHYRQSFLKLVRLQMTTKRIRNHELEELSLAALRFVLPPKWVIHDFRRDYGIDVQVELFDKNGLATGLRCYGQLKATDNPDDDDSLALDRDHFEYWAAHTDPVLLLRYYASTQQFSWCWLHDVAWSLKPDAQSLSVLKFLQPWDKTKTSENIQDFLHQRSRAFTERRCLPFDVSIRGDEVDIEKLAVIAEMANRSANSGAFRFRADQSPTASFVVTATLDRVGCSYLGLPGIAVTDTKDSNAEDFAGLVLLLVFLTSCRYDRILAARPLLKGCFEVLQKAAGKRFFFPFVDSSVYTVGLEETVKLFQTKSSASSAPVLGTLFLGVAYVAALRYGESAQLVALLRTELKGATSNVHRAAIAYSLGNALSQTNEWTEALSMFRLAVVSMPEYEERVYFLHEYGAALFEAGLFAEAADQYRAALAREPSVRLRCLLGDVLFSAGEFSESLAELEVALSGDLDEVSFSSTRLLQVLCQEMIEVWGLDRLEHAAMSDGGVAVCQAFTSDQLRQLPVTLRPLISKFGSDALFNFNVGHTAISNGHARLAAFRYFHCAMRQRGDSEAWALALGCAMSAKDEVLLSLGVVVGYFYVGERLLTDFFKCSQFAGANQSSIESLRRQFADLVYSVAERHQKQAVTVRFVGPDATREFSVL
jgi:tetratricopeptide (TPR) repeat protein